MKRFKKLFVLVSVITVVVIYMAGSALAAGTISPTVAVTGTLNAKCTAGTTGAMAFTIDPSLAGPIAATVTDATVFCSKNAPFTVTAESLNKGGVAASCAGAGITGTLKDGANTMDYTFICGTGSGTGQGFGVGKDQALGITGSIASASYQDAAVSALYADTVTLTITY
jgi:spore coat protein U-like protein